MKKKDLACGFETEIESFTWRKMNWIIDSCSNQYLVAIVYFPSFRWNKTTDIPEIQC